MKGRRRIHAFRRVPQTSADVAFYLRLAVGVPEIVSAVQKLLDLPSFLGVWRMVALPGAGILAPAYAAAEFLGALLLLVGWKTRTVAVLFVAELVGEIFLTKQPLLELSGWMVELQSLCVVLILARLGAGRWSLDRFLALNAGTGLGAATGPGRHARAK